MFPCQNIPVLETALPLRQAHCAKGLCPRDIMVGLQLISLDLCSLFSL